MEIKEPFERLGDAIQHYRKLVVELTYQSYAVNRRLYPDVTDWSSIFKDAGAFEKRFLSELPA